MSAQKTAQNGQWGRTSLDGLAHDPPADTLNDRGRAPMVDEAGRVVVRLADGGGFPSPGLNTRSEFKSIGALVSTVTLFAGQCQIVAITGHKSIATPCYVQIYDGLAAVGTPALVVPLAGGADESFSLVIPWNLAAGCTLALSTSRLGFVATAPAASLYYSAYLLTP